MKRKLLCIGIVWTLIGTHLTAQSSLSDKPSTEENRLDLANTSKLAATLGASLANKESKNRFDTEPFRPDAAQAIFRGDHWEWQATAGFGKGDLRATVTFGQDGSEPKVEIATLANENDL